MAYLGAGLDAVNETLSTINMVCDTMTGNGVLTTKVLGSPTAPGSVNNVSVYYDGVAQTPTTDYTLSGSTITFSEAPASNVNVVILSYADEFSKTISDNTVYTDVIEDSAITNNKILGISASKLTGALPAIDGSALTGVSAIDPVLINETSNPTVSSMTATGNGVGTIWVNSTTGAMFICTDSTVGANVWLNVGAGSGSFYPTPTGGTVATLGDFKVHSFTSSGTFNIYEISDVIGGVVDYLVLGGGGGGGATAGGGGGAGRHLSGSSFAVTAQNYTITVGGGGAPDTNGEDSVFSTITAIGGGAGGTVADNGNNGGSGGGGSFNGFSGGTGVFNGGNGAGVSTSGCGGGGGGAGSAGTNAVSGQAGNGGNGVANSITGISVTRAAGGGGAGNASANGGTGGGAGAGNGGKYSTISGGAGLANSGSGAGGGQNLNAVGVEIGGSGIVIIKYRFQ
jgi:hypothetical protein